MKSRILPILSVMLLLGLIIAMGLEFKHLNRVLQLGNLLRNSALAGFIAGLPLGALLIRKIHAREDRAPAFFGILFFFTLTAPYFGSLSNRLITTDSPVPSQVELLSEAPYQQFRFGFLRSRQQSPDGYRSFFYLDGQLYKVQTRQPLFTGITPGDQTIIPLHKGFWNFPFVHEP
jgi:hypothetical protein